MVSGRDGTSAILLITVPVKFHYFSEKSSYTSHSRTISLALIRFLGKIGIIFLEKGIFNPIDLRLGEIIVAMNKKRLLEAFLCHFRI